MPRESTGRLLTALRLALYPALESAEARHFQALTTEAQKCAAVGIPGKGGATLFDGGGRSAVFS